MTNKDLRLDYADMKKSFENFRNLFAMINKDENIQIPSQWLWDMLEDFIDQFAFFQMYKDKIIGKFVDGEEAKKKEFAESGVWSFAAVLKILHSCVAAANVEIPKTESVSASVAGKKEKETIDEKEDFDR
jgi:translation initiation factor 3 subunit L